jgi:hypothetical protein
MKKEESAALKAKSDEMTQLRKEKAESDKRYFTIIGNNFTCEQNMKESELKHYNNVVAYNAKLDISGNNKTKTAAAVQQEKLNQFSFYKMSCKLVCSVHYISCIVYSHPPL